MTDEYCFAYDRFRMGKYPCKVLCTNCNGMNEECSFYKTLPQFLEDNEKSLERLATLPEQKQEHISEMYYFGSHPWRKT